MSTARRSRGDAAIGWLFLAYGVFSVGLEAWLRHDEITIATGLETILLALVDFLWAGQLVALAWALRLLAAVAPLVAYGTTPLFWRDTTPFVSEAFWTSTGLGVALAIPLLLLGHLSDRASKAGSPAEDPRWFRALRWAFRGGLALVVLTLRAGAWSSEAIAAVYAGAALAIAALVIVVPRRVRFRRFGVGGLLAILGTSALALVAAAKLAVGSRMSVEEAAIGAVPAALVTVLGLALVVRRSSVLRRQSSVIRHQSSVVSRQSSVVSPDESA